MAIRRNRFLCAGLVLAALSLGPCPPFPPDPVTAEENTTVEGIHIEDVDRDANEKLAWLKILSVSDTPLPATWAALRDIGRWDRFVGLLSDVKCLKHDGPVSRYLFVVDLPWPLSDTEATLQVKTDEDKHQLDYRVEEGFMKGSYGKVSVGERKKGTWVLFENYGRPGSRFPDWMVEIGVHLVFPSVLDDFYEEIEKNMRESQPKSPPP